MAIAFVNASDLGENGGSATSLNVNYTVGTGSNRLLVVAFAGDTSSGNDDITSVTYNGVAMTLALKLGAGGGYTDRFIYLYYLLNPASGSNAVIINCTNGHYLIALAADYEGVKQSGQPDATASNTANPAASSLTTSITVVASGSWPVLLGYSYTDNNPQTAGAGTIRRVFGVVFGVPNLFDSNGPVTSGSYNMTTNTSAPGTIAGMGAIVASFAPAPDAAAEVLMSAMVM